MQLSENLKKFCLFFSPIFKSAGNFKHIKTKMTLIAYVLPELETVKDMVRFRGPFDRKHDKSSQALMKSA